MKLPSVPACVLAIDDSPEVLALLAVRLKPDAQGMPVAFEKPCWSLFFHRAKYVKTWGFMRRWPNAATMLWSKHGEQDPQSGGTDWWHRAPKGRDEPRRMAA